MTLESHDRPPVVLTIAGFDPSAGAGILADIKTISAFRCFGVAAVTSLTFQNTQGVFGAVHQTGRSIRGQVEPLLSDFDIAAVKTGMLPSAAIIEEVAALITANGLGPVVVDPVIRSTSGFDLIDGDALAALVEKLFPLAALVTPNAAEAERLAGFRVHDLETMRNAAAAICALGAPAVLVKGGEIGGDTATDLLMQGERVRTFSAERVVSSSTHGTGCTLSSAVASLLARGKSLDNAIAQAKGYVVAAIRDAAALGHGHGPLNHFPAVFDVD